MIDDSAHGGSPGEESPLVPTALRVEYERKPTNIPAPSEPLDSDALKFHNPRFAWEIAGPRGAEQSAYRVVVADGPETISGESSPVWDSGIVSSSQSIGITYDGPPLEPNESYYWAVRVYDSNGRASDWSHSAKFTTAIPDTEEYWQGSWIGPDYGDPKLTGNEWCNYTFEATFTIEAGAAGFVFRATSRDDLYAWKIHGTEGTTPILSLRVREDGNWRTLDDVALDDSIQPEADCHIAIQVEDDTIVTSIDGIDVDRRTDSTHGAGTVGFRHVFQERVRIHDVRVSRPDGRVLLEDSFDAVPGISFDGGIIKDGALVIDGANDPADVVLHTEKYDRPSPLLRREFTVSKKIERARLHVAGLGYYEIYLNGERVGDRVLDPGQTNYDNTVLFSTYAVTSQLRRGENALGAALGRGRFGELVPNVWYWDDSPWWDDPKLLVQLDIDFVDGGCTSVVTDDAWVLTDGPTRFDSLYRGEVYDARKERDGWTNPGFDDEGWARAPIVSAPDGDLIPQQMPPIKIGDALDPVDVHEPEPGIYVFDIGQVIAGWIELTVEGEAGTVVTATLGEKLHDDGTVDVSSSAIVGPIQTDQYILRGDGTETWEPRFSYKGFRYVQLDGFPGDPTVGTITAKTVHTTIDAGDESHFACSNELLTQIHENTEWAYLNNHHSIPTDTPKYEKNGWTGDAQVTAETGLYNYSMERFYAKWLRDFRDAQRQTGELPAIIPTSGWSYSDTDCSWEAVKGIVPETGISSILIPWWLYQYAGDTRILERQYAGMKRYLQRLRDHADDHVLRVGLGDWPNAVEGPAIISSAYYYRGAEILSEAARIVGTEDEAATFESLAEDIGDAFNQQFFDAGTGIYRTGETDEYRQTSNCFPLAFDMVPEEHAHRVIENLVTDIVETRDGHLSTNVFGTKYLLPVLSEYGYHDVAYQIATQTTYPSWGHWILNDQTSLLETWSLDSRSVNHHFFGSIDEWFYKYLAGITVGKPGFRKVEIKPYLVDDLDWVNARVDTVRGTISSSWERHTTDVDVGDGTRLSLNVSIPGNTVASVSVPTLGAGRIHLTEGGTTLWKGNRGLAPGHPDIVSVDCRGDYVTAKVGSGSYAFELEPLD